MNVNFLKWLEIRNQFDVKTIQSKFICVVENGMRNKTKKMFLKILYELAICSFALTRRLLNICIITINPYN